MEVKCDRIVFLLVKLTEFKILLSLPVELVGNKERPPIGLIIDSIQN